VPRARLLDSEPFSFAKAEVAVGARASPGSAKGRHDYIGASQRGFRRPSSLTAVAPPYRSAKASDTISPWR
jgi:hypothetical protein